MKKCLFCNAEVQKSERICPNCGKRCFSRNWLIVVIILGIFIVVGIFGNSNETNNQTTNNTSNNSEEENNYQTNNETSNNSAEEDKESKKEPKKYGLNEPVIITTSEGSYKLTLTGVIETSERNQFSDKQANRVILISYEYENIDSEENVYIFDSHFKIYDNENNSLETYPISEKAGESVSIGRKTSASMAYALNSSTNHIEVEHYSNMFNSKYDCIFDIKW